MRIRVRSSVERRRMALMEKRVRFVGILEEGGERRERAMIAGDS